MITYLTVIFIICCTIIGFIVRKSFMVINRGTPSIVSTITNGTLVTENNSRDRTSNNDTEEIHEQQSTSGQIEEVDKRTHVDPPEIHQNH